MFYSLVIIQAQWNTTLQKHTDIILKSTVLCILTRCLFKPQLKLKVSYWLLGLMKRGEPVRIAKVRPDLETCTRLLSLRNQIQVGLRVGKWWKRWWRRSSLGAPPPPPRPLPSALSLDVLDCLREIYGLAQPNQSVPGLKGPTWCQWKVCGVFRWSSCTIRSQFITGPLSAISTVSLLYISMETETESMPVQGCREKFHLGRAQFAVGWGWGSGNGAYVRKLQIGVS